MVVTDNEVFSVIVPDYLESSETGSEVSSEQDHDEAENENEDTQNEIEEENENVTVDYSYSLDSIIINQQAQYDVLNAMQEQNDTIISSLELVTNGVHLVSNLSLLVVICTVALLIGKLFKNILV